MPFDSAKLGHFEKAVFLLTFSTFLGTNCHDILFRIYRTYILMQIVILPPNL